MNTAFHDALAALATYVRERHPREDPSALASVSCRLLEHIKPLILSWGRSEHRCARLFALAER